MYVCTLSKDIKVFIVTQLQHIATSVHVPHQISDTGAHYTVSTKAAEVRSAYKIHVQ